MEKQIEQINWKKRIKYLQIANLIAIVVLYFMWGFFTQQKAYFDQKNQEFEQKQIELTNLQAEKNQIDLTSQRIAKIIKNKEKFISAYNACHYLYVKSKYALSGTNVLSLKDCMYNKWLNFSFIKNMKDSDIEKIAVGMWVLKNTNSKLLFPETQILYSLDKNIFGWNMEKYVQMISFGYPKLVNKNLNLYAVDFSFKTQTNYSMFKNLLLSLQDKMFSNTQVYYAIKWVSSFDITQNSDQNVLVQASVYFVK